MKFCFGDIVVVHKDQIGVVVKSWYKPVSGHHEHDVYIRLTDQIETIPEQYIQRYMVRHKYLDEDELVWQANSQM